MILVSLCRILNGLSDEINLFLALQFSFNDGRRHSNGPMEFPTNSMYPFSAGIIWNMLVNSLLIEHESNICGIYSVIFYHTATCNCWCPIVKKCFEKLDKIMLVGTILKQVPPRLLHSNVKGSKGKLYPEEIWNFDDGHHLKIPD